MHTIGWIHNIYFMHLALLLNKLVVSYLVTDSFCEGPLPFIAKPPPVAARSACRFLFNHLMTGVQDHTLLLYAAAPCNVNDSIRLASLYVRFCDL